MRKHLPTALRKYKNKIKSRCGATLEYVNTLLRRQKGRCAICGGRFVGRRRPDLDHNHKTRKPRGLLCNSCNRGIGLLKDRVSILRSAVRYLEEYTE